MGPRLPERRALFISVPAGIVSSGPVSIPAFFAVPIAHIAIFQRAAYSASYSLEADTADELILSGWHHRIQVCQDGLSLSCPKPCDSCFLLGSLDGKPSSGVGDKSSFLTCPLDGVYCHEAHVLQGVSDFHFSRKDFPIPANDWDGLQNAAHFGFFGRQPFRFFFSISSSATR